MNKNEPQTEMPGDAISRREFLKQAGAGMVAVAAVGVGGVNLLRKPLPYELQLSS